MSERKTKLRNEAFLGRDWSFPPNIDDGGVRMCTDEQDIEESLFLLLSTSPGERVNRYDYGCPLRRYTFEPITTETTISMRNDIARAIILFEPRITLEDVSFEMQQQIGVLLIHLTYTIIRTNNRNNMVYPFYLDEGTNVSR